MKQLFARLLAGSGKGQSQPGALRLKADLFPRAIYAVGDIHGCLDLLELLEEQIVDHAEGRVDDIWVVLLGDYIDRGPSSAQTLEHISAPSKHGFRRICLSGNHEQSMLDALNDREAFAHWCRYGGIETLASYGISHEALNLTSRSWNAVRRQLSTHIPQRHLDFIADLPIMLQVPGFIFVHAGLRPGIDLEHQSDREMRNIREPFLNSAHDFGSIVVHGHTITEHVVISERRIGIDTGAYATGRLSAIVLTSANAPQVLEAQA